MRSLRDKTNPKGNPVADYHLSVKTVSRSAGRSATAAAAYRAGVEITDERTGEIHDYTRKGGVVSADLLLPADAPEWAADRAALWNAAEQAEKRKNSTVAREFEIALPAELSADERRRLAIDFAQEIVTRHGCAADVCIHEPSKGGDDRNHHAHVLVTTRRLTADGLGEKTRELDDMKTGPELVTQWRARFADLQNERLRENGIEARVDHRSLEAQGIDREATRHLGPAATGYERRTGESSRKRLDFEQEATDRLAKAKALGELERQEAIVDKTILDLSGDLTAAKAERQNLLEQAKRDAAQEAHKRAESDSDRLAGLWYASALRNVTSETVATIPGILPDGAVRAALQTVGSRLNAERQALPVPVDLEAVKANVLAMPAYQQRLAMADRKEASGRATLDDVASMGALKRLVHDTKAMAAEANSLIAEAGRDRNSVYQDVARSPEMENARRSNEDANTKRQALSAKIEQFNKMYDEYGKTGVLWQRPENLYRLPGVVAEVADEAKRIAPNTLAGMRAAEIERMTEKAQDVAWTKPELKGSQHSQEFQERQSRFVLPAEQRKQQQERERQQSQDRQNDHGLGL